MKVIAPRVEKDYNQSLNVWLRCPFSVIMGWVMMAGAFIHPHHFTGAPHKYMHALTGLHHFWNGCFFMYRTVDARTRFVIKQKMEADKTA